MLRELRISNFAVVEKQEICFGPGLNVISGETGSGKSIILQALNLILGAKPRSDFFRAGADSWEIEALFDLSSFKTGVLNEMPEIARSQELIISRTQNRSGRSRILINGRLGSSAIVQEIGRNLIESCSHAESLRLTSPLYQLTLIDRFGDLEALREKYSAIYRNWRESAAQLSALESDRAKWSERRSELEFMLQEFQALDLRQGLRADLEGQIKLLSNAEKVNQHARAFDGALNGSGAALESVRAAGNELKRLQQIDARFEALVLRFQNCQAELEDCGSEVLKKVSEVELDQSKLEALREKLSELARLERKYHCSEQGLLQLALKAKQELTQFSGGAGPDELRTEVNQLHGEVQKLSQELTQRRLASVKRMSKLVEKELAELNMPSVRVDCEHRSLEFNESGADQFELMFSANKGEDLKPIGRIASAGELSRIMLVLKKVWGEYGAISVLVFDEVDSGVSGAVARAVGEKLKEIAQHSQVICITHLPQVASLADRHFQVSKSEGERTLSIVKELSGDNQVEEIARMLSGKKITKAALLSAKELLNQ